MTANYGGKNRQRKETTNVFKKKETSTRRGKAHPAGNGRKRQRGEGQPSRLLQKRSKSRDRSGERGPSVLWREERGKKQRGGGIINAVRRNEVTIKENEDYPWRRTCSSTTKRKALRGKKGGRSRERRNKR